MSKIIYDFFFFKQKTAYEMRISDWSSDVCSSDLPTKGRRGRSPDLRQTISSMTDQTPATPPPADENHLIAERRAKLAALREQGIAFPNDFRRRSEERRVGQEGVSPGSSRWSPDH